MGGTWGLAFALVPTLWERSSNVAGLTGVQSPFWAPQPNPPQDLRGITSEQFQHFFSVVSQLYMQSGKRSDALRAYHGRGQDYEYLRDISTEVKRLATAMTRRAGWKLTVKLQEIVESSGVSLWALVKKNNLSEVRLSLLSFEPPDLTSGQAPTANMARVREACYQAVAEAVLGDSFWEDDIQVRTPEAREFVNMLLELYMNSERTQVRRMLSELPDAEDQLKRAREGSYTGRPLP